MLLTPPSGEKHVLPNMIEAGSCNCLCNKPHTSGPTNSAHLVSPSENTNNTAHKAGAKQCSGVVGDALLVLQRPVAAHSEAAQKHQQISEGTQNTELSLLSHLAVSRISLERRDRRNSLAPSFTQIKFKLHIHMQSCCIRADSPQNCGLYPCVWAHSTFK
jgi:hypothetical protein